MRSSLQSKLQEDQDENLNYYNKNSLKQINHLRLLKKQSLFAQRRAAAAAATPATPTKTKTILDLAQEPDTLK
ncbi:unnamed protein product [Cunninghamella echinulata]